VHVECSRKTVEELFVVGDQVGLTRQKCGHVALCDVVQEGDEFVTHAISTEPWISVRLVDGNSDATESAQFVGFCTPNREEWLSRGTPHARQTIDSRPTHEVEQHRFGLIIGGVAGEDTGWKHGKACGPGARFEVGTVVEGNAVCNELGSKSTTDFGDEVRLCRRFGPKPVVDMVCGRRQTCGDRKNHESHRVGASRRRARDGTRRGKVGSGEEDADEISLANADRHLTLAAPRVARRADLLHVAGNDPDDCPSGRDGENDADPPMPRIRSEHVPILAIRARS